ncbi:unnamed protein product [Malus baccata var. baccata]
MVPVVIRYSDDSPCVISQEEKDENRGYVEFQIVSFINRIRRLTSHLQLHKKKTIYLREIYVKFWENANDYCLICQRKIEYFIKN